MAIITKSLDAGGKMIAVVGLKRFCEKCEAVFGQKRAISNGLERRSHPIRSKCALRAQRSHRGLSPCHEGRYKTNDGGGKDKAQ